MLACMHAWFLAGFHVTQSPGATFSSEAAVSRAINASKGVSVIRLSTLRLHGKPG